MKILNITLIFLVILVLIIIGCSQNREILPEDFENNNFLNGERENLSGDENIEMPGPGPDMPERGDMEDMRADMESKAIEACSNMNIGDTCEIETEMGTMNGECAMTDETLSCRITMEGPEPN